MKVKKKKITDETKATARLYRRKNARVKKELSFSKPNDTQLT